MKYFIELRDHSVHEVYKFRENTWLSVSFNVSNEWWNNWIKNMTERLSDSYFLDQNKNKYFVYDTIYFWSES